jgi:hypothetical protein
MRPTLPMKALRTGSRSLAWFCLAAAIVWPLAAGGWALLGNQAELFSSYGVHPPAEWSVPLKTAQRLLLTTLALLPALAAAAGVWALRTCFLLFSAGDFFSVRTVRLLRRFAGWTFCHTAVGLVVQPLSMAVLCLGFPAGQREVLISFGPQQFQSLLIAGTVWVISGAMAEAGLLAEENAQFI